MSFKGSCTCKFLCLIWKSQPTTAIIFGLNYHTVMGNKSIRLSFQARMKRGWGSKHGGNTDVCRWFMCMCWANKESEVQNNTDNSEGKLHAGRMTVIVQIMRKSEVTVKLHPLEANRHPVRKEYLTIHFFLLKGFLWVGKQHMVFFAVFYSFPNPSCLSEYR